MPDLTLTNYTSPQFANQLTSARRSVKIAGQGAGGDTGLQRIGILTSNAGDVATVYYDPSAHTIIWASGLAAISQQ